MRTSVAVLLFFRFIACEAFAQTEAPLRRYSVGGIVVIPYTQSLAKIEVRLVNELGIPIDRVWISSQERFHFSNLPAGRYVVTIDLAGFKPVRQRVEASEMSWGTSLSIILDPVEENRTKNAFDLMGNNGLVDVAQMNAQAKTPKHLDEAEKTLQRGSISEARRRLESIVRGDPESYDARRLLGSAYQQSQRYREAEKEYRVARGLQPRSVVPLISLGGLYLEEVERGGMTPNDRNALLHEARQVLSQAVEVNPQASLAHYLLGVAYYRCSMDSEAAKSYQRSLELEPRLAPAHLGLTNLYIRVRNWPAALEELNAYLRDTPQAPGREQLLLKRTQLERLVKPQP